MQKLVGKCGQRRLFFFTTNFHIEAKSDGEIEGKSAKQKNPTNFPLLNCRFPTKTFPPFDEKIWWDQKKTLKMSHKFVYVVPTFVSNPALARSKYETSSANKISRTHKKKLAVEGLKCAHGTSDTKNSLTKVQFEAS